MSNTTILNKAIEFVKEYFAKSTLTFLIYHNLNHTQGVVDACKEIADSENLDSRSYTILQVAAWFHDVGYLVSRTNHEEESVKLFIEFAAKNDIEKSFTKEVIECILATKPNVVPSSLVQKILVDADLYTLGTESHFDKADLLREEIESVKKERIGLKDWLEIEIEFMENHQYFTDCAIDNLEPVKQKNLLIRKNQYQQLLKHSDN